jgi:hypothetical protein
MISETSHAPSTVEGGGRPAIPARYQARVRRWARVGVAGQALFVVSGLVAAVWQGPRYSVLADSVSDMYARTAPGGIFLAVAFTLCGAATIWFAMASVRPALRSGGWPATAGSTLLALSVVGLGDLLSPAERLACRMADPGCTSARQISNLGGRLDDILTSGGVLVLVLAGLFLAAAMKRAPGWRTWALPTRWMMVAILGLLVAVPLSQNVGLGGLSERVLEDTVAAALAALGIGIIRRCRPTDPQIRSAAGCRGPR